MIKRTGPWIDQDPSLRRRIVNGAFVERRECRRIIKKMDLVRRNMREEAEPTCITIVGPPGVGKSKLLKTYADGNRGTETIEQGCIVRSYPVLYVQLQQNLTVSDVADLAMRVLMGNGAPQGRIVGKSLFVEQLKLRRVELFIIDEAQHTLARGAEITRGTTRDWIKSLTKETGIPVVMAGIDTIEPIVDGDDQLSQLTPYRFVLDRFDYTTAADQRGFSKFLNEYDSLLPFDELALLGEADRARRLHLASAGTLRYLCQLLRVAAYLAIDEHCRCIRDRDLAAAFEDVGGAPVCQHNPFEEFL